jgi:hypothetical protein
LAVAQHVDHHRYADQQDDNPVYGDRPDKPSHALLAELFPQTSPET